MRGFLRLRFWLIVLMVAAALFCPYRSTTAPAWRVQVVDENGKPIPTLRIKQAWQFFDVDIAPWEDDRVTDSQGRAAFPRRTTWASLARRVSLVDSGFFIQACDEDHLEEAKLFWEGNRYWNPSAHMPESRMIAKPVKQCGEID